MLFGQTEIDGDELVEHFHFFKKYSGSEMGLGDVLTIAEVLNDKRYYVGEALEVFKDHITPSFLIHVADAIYYECRSNGDMKDEEGLLISVKRELRETWEIKDLLEYGIITIDKEKVANDFFEDSQVPIDYHIKWNNDLVKYHATNTAHEPHKYHLLQNGMYLSARNIAWNEDRDITLTNIFLDMNSEFRKQFVDKKQAKEIEQPKSTKAQELSLMLEGEKFEYSKPKDRNLSAKL